jgi:hypothetical protein
MQDEDIAQRLRLLTVQHASLQSLPQEILLQIFTSLACPLALWRVSTTCRALRAVGLDNLVWMHLALGRFPRASREISALFSSLSSVENAKSGLALPFDRFYQVYLAFLLPYGRLFGFWHMDYSFFHGGLLRVRLATRTEALDGDPLLVVGERLDPEDRMALASSVPFSLDAAVSFDLAPVGVPFKATRQFVISMSSLVASSVNSIAQQHQRQKRSSIPSNASGFTNVSSHQPSSTTANLARPTALVCNHSSALQSEHPTRHTAALRWIALDSAPESEQPLNFNLSAQEITERLQTHTFPLGKPCPVTGLWPYPSPYLGSAETIFRTSATHGTSSPN